MVTKKRKFNFSNKLSYTLIAIFALVFIGAGVYAVSPGVTGNPGHTIQSIGAPSGCADGQVLTYTVDSRCLGQSGASSPGCWVCSSVSTGLTSIPANYLRDYEFKIGSRSTPSTKGVFQSVQATCSTGKQVIGGGCNFGAPSGLPAFTIENSYPYPSTSLTGWTCDCLGENTISVSISIYAYAICADVD